MKYSIRRYLKWNEKYDLIDKYRGKCADCGKDFLGWEDKDWWRSCNDLTHWFNYNSFLTPNIKVNRDTGQIVDSNCAGVEFHHILSLEEGGNNEISNFIPLCKECHLIRHNKLSMIL